MLYILDYGNMKPCTIRGVLDWSVILNHDGSVVWLINHILAKWSDSPWFSPLTKKSANNWVNRCFGQVMCQKNQYWLIHLSSKDWQFNESEVANLWVFWQNYFRSPVRGIPMRRGCATILTFLRFFWKETGSTLSLWSLYCTSLDTIGGTAERYVPLGMTLTIFYHR